MLDLGLSPAEYSAFLRALRSDHRIRIDLTIRNRDEKPIGSLSAPINRVLSGSVQVDATAEVTRSLEISVLDPKRELRFEPDSPVHGALYADRFISVRYEVFVPDVIEGWVSVPVFWGPLTGYSRSGGQVSIEAQGKESLLLEPHFATEGYTIQKGQRLDTAIRRVARQAGERRFSLPNLPHRLRQERSITPRTEPWRVLAGGYEDAQGNKLPGLVKRAPGNRRIFYDGRGRLALRRINKKASFTFREGRELIDPPEIVYDDTTLRNTVVVIGRKPEGKPAPRAKVVLSAKHPLSPQKLSRNGEPRYRTEFHDTELKTDAECRERAKEILDNLAAGGIEPSLTTLPIPHLEEDDRVALSTSEWTFTFRLRRFSIPLTATDSMTVGSNRPVKKWRRRRSGKYNR